MSELASRSTPIDDSYPTCERTEATLGVYNIDPDLVTQKLGIKPTGSQKKGVMGKRVITTTNSWLLSSENFVASKDLRRHIDWLMDKIEPVAAQIYELQELPNCKMAIRCAWWSATGEGGPTLWPEQMQRMANLNLEWSCSFSYYGDDDDKKV